MAWEHEEGGRKEEEERGKQKVRNGRHFPRPPLMLPS